MATNNSSIGYSPLFHMPLIAGPPEGTDPASHYAAIDASNTTLATFQGDNRITFNLSDQSQSTIFAMTGGRVRFYPPGASLPDGTTESSPAGFGTVGLEPWTADVSQLAQATPDGVVPGSEPPAHILYSNVNATEFSNAMAPHISEMSIPALQSSWSGGGSAPANRSPLETDFLGQVMTGDTFVFLPGGSAIGAAGPSTAIATDVQMDLAFVNTGSSLFSPQVLLTYMPSIAGALWAGHPILASMAGSPLTVDLHVRFEMFDMASLSYIPIPEGMEVSVIDYDPVSNDTLATESADANGQVHFNSFNLSGQAGDEPDIFFLVHTNGQTLGGETLPSEWSTDGWESTSGNPGYIEDFKGGSIGSSGNPLVFRIGLDFHFLVKYEDHETKALSLVPEDLEVHLRGESLTVSTWDSGAYRVNGDGEIHGVLFDASPGDTAFIEVQYNLSANPSINMEAVQAKANLLDAEYLANWALDPNMIKWIDINKSIGTYSSPEEIVLKEIAKGHHLHHLFNLASAREWSEFLFTMTGGDWPGVELSIFDTAIAFSAYSWPPGHVNIPFSVYFNRYIFFHEVSHQIMWNYMQVNPVKEWIDDNYDAQHQGNEFINGIHAMIESWAQFFGMIFSHHYNSFPYAVSTLKDGSSLGPPLNNRGLSVEGAMTNALWLYFRKFVVTPAVTHDPSIHPTLTGKLADNPKNAWVNNPDVAIRFTTLIWEPFKLLGNNTLPNTTFLIENIKAASGIEWFQHKACFYIMNAGIEDITATNLTTTSGPLAGGTQVFVQGTGFVAELSFSGKTVRMEVLFDGEEGLGVLTHSDAGLEVLTPPGTATGLVDVTVNLIVRDEIAHSVTLTDAFEYV